MDKIHTLPDIDLTQSNFIRNISSFSCKKQYSAIKKYDWKTNLNK